MGNGNRADDHDVSITDGLDPVVWESLVWNCPLCGWFTSRRTLERHRLCLMEIDRDSGLHELYGVVQ